MINTETYPLSEKNFIKVKSIKKRILIGNTFSSDMNHYVGWLNRYNGKYKKTAMFTISFDGKIHQHFEPTYNSAIIGNLTFDESTISILIENEGWLTKDLNEENKYITHVGNIYNRTQEVFEKKWRRNKYWSPYTQQQHDSLIYLIDKLCDEFKIPKNVIPHNTKINNGYSHVGIMYKGNLDIHFTDLNPSWNFIEIKDKLELKNIENDK